MVTGVAEERLGQVSHAAAVERNWFQHYLGDRPREEITGNVRGDAPSLRWIYVPIIREYARHVEHAPQFTTLPGPRDRPETLIGGDSAGTLGTPPVPQPEPPAQGLA